VDIKDRVKQLREALDLTQEQVATAGWGSKDDRPQVSKIETGANNVSTSSARKKLARGLAVPLTLLEDLLDDRITIEQAIARARKTGDGATPATHVDRTEADAPTHDDDAPGADVAAVQREISRLQADGVLTWEQAQRAAAEVTEFARSIDPLTGPKEVARGLASATKIEGTRAKLGAIFARYATGKHDATLEPRKTEHAADTNAEGAAAAAKLGITEPVAAPTKSTKTRSEKR
jgi:transcriptional regulator with XRE-family HTH domain